MREKPNPPTHATDSDPKQEVSRAALFELIYTRALQGEDVPTLHCPNLRTQHIAASHDDDTQTNFYAIASETSGRETAVHLSWRSSALIFRCDQGTLTLTKLQGGEIKAEGAIINQRIPERIFNRLGFLWAPLYAQTRYGVSPEAITKNDLQEIHARFLASQPVKEKQEIAARRLTSLYAIDDPKTPALIKMRTYETGLADGLFTESDVEAFAPRGFKDIKSVIFLIRVRFARVAQAAAFAMFGN